jgi:copper chaperone CopZ
MVETVPCELCGAAAKYPVKIIIDGRELSFCCGGCLQVYELMREEGQSGGEAQASPATKAASSEVGQNQSKQASETISLSIGGMSCANCVATVERSLRNVPGVIDVNVSLETERAVVEIANGAGKIEDLKQAVRAAGYEALDIGGRE